MKKMDWKDIAKRAGKTFAQAFVASFGIDRLTEITDLESAKAVLYPMLISCVAAHGNELFQRKGGLVK